LRADLLRIDDSQEMPETVKQSNLEKLNNAPVTRRLNEKTRFYKVR